MVFALLHLLVAPAHACSCADEGPSPVPADGAVGVTTSAVPVLFYDFGTDATLTLASDAGLVAGTSVLVESAGAVDYLFFEPDAALEPLTTYTLSDGEHASRFTTGDGAPAEAPGTPVVVSSESGAWRPHTVDCGVIEDNSCGESAYAQVEVEGKGDYYEARVIVGGEAFTVLSPTTTVQVSSALCYDNVPALLDATSGTVEVRAVDLSGEAGGWTEPVAFTLDWPGDAECPADEAKGCAAAPFGPWWLALPLVAVRLRRR